jgi:hypothetical protein
MSDNHDKLSTSTWERPKMGISHQYYGELIRIVSMMFVGVLALMTFLLTVGFQRPHADFSYALYTTIIVLALNLVFYVVAHMFFMQVAALKPASEDVSEEVASGDKDDEKAGKAVVSTSTNKSKFEAAKSRLRVVRILQQILFLAAVCSVAWLALATAHFFFTIPAASSTTGQ